VTAAASGHLLIAALQWVSREHIEDPADLDAALALMLATNGNWLLTCSVGAR
jgi:hypothetical protein